MTALPTPTLASACAVPSHRYPAARPADPSTAAPGYGGGDLPTSRLKAFGRLAMGEPVRAINPQLKHNSNPGVACAVGEATFFSAQFGQRRSSLSSNHVDGSEYVSTVLSQDAGEVSSILLRARPANQEVSPARAGREGSHLLSPERSGPFPDADASPGVSSSHEGMAVDLRRAVRRGGGGPGRGAHHSSRRRAARVHRRCRARGRVRCARSAERATIDLRYISGRPPPPGVAGRRRPSRDARAPVRGGGT